MEGRNKAIYGDFVARERAEAGKGRGVHQGILNALKRRLDRNRLGELLVTHGVLSPQQLRYALVRQQSTNTPLGRLLLQEQIIRRRELYRALGEQWTFRVLTTAMTLTIAMTAFSSKSARAAPIRDVPAQISLAGVANAAFSAVDYYPALFGSEERASANLKPFTKWTQMFDRLEAGLKTGPGQKSIQAFQGDLENMKGMPLAAMARKVNTLVNKTPYIEDSQKWGMSDYWATPIEFLNRGGDCEDFAISKYTALRMLGVPEERLRIAIVHDLQKNIPHAILIVYTDDGAMILDNQSSEARFAQDISKYKPIFSINRTAWWLHTKPKDTVMASAQ
jgi:predicted transglutaminase-like cysteine proteinase